MSNRRLVGILHIDNIGFESQILKESYNEYVADWSTVKSAYLHLPTETTIKMNRMKLI